MEIKNKVLGYFEQHGNQGLAGQTEEEKLNCYYLDTGVIDSMGIIMMVMYLEQEFGVQFSAEDMQSYEFQTPKGLISLIEKYRQEQA